MAGSPADVPVRSFWSIRSFRSTIPRAVELLRQRFTDSTLITAAAGVVLLLGAAVASLLLSVGTGSADSPEPAPPPVFTPAPAPTTTISMISVHAAGAVRQPGLHRVPTGSRVADLIEIAGGVDDSIDIDRINLAAPVADGERVYLPRRGESVPVPAQSAPAPGGPGQSTGPLDLNTATQQQLEALPGIGPSTAAAILSARSVSGRFTSVEDLLDVRGIGMARLEQLRGLVVVR